MTERDANIEEPREKAYMGIIVSKSTFPRVDGRGARIYEFDVKVEEGQGLYRKRIVYSGPVKMDMINRLEFGQELCIYGKQVVVEQRTEGKGRSRCTIYSKQLELPKERNRY